MQITKDRIVAIKLLRIIKNRSGNKNCDTQKYVLLLYKIIIYQNSASLYTNNF